MQEIILNDLHRTEQKSFKENYTTKEVATNYGVLERTVGMHKDNHDDELIENIHYFYSLEQTKGGRQRIIRWTLEGVYMLGFFIKSQQAKIYRKKVAEFLRLCDEARQKKFNEARATITQQTDKIANLESVLISKQRNHNNVINGYKGVIVKRNNVVKALKDEIKNKDSVYSLLENAVIQADKEIKRLELKNKEILQSIKGKDTGIYDKHYEYLEKENKELRKLVRKDGRVDADVYLGLKSEVEKRINNTCYLIEDIKEKLNFDLEDLQRYVFYGNCKNDPKQAEIKLKSKIQRMNNGN